ncbi:NADH-quinone oxidoreductase subunit NuoN [Microbaculum sp. FT89]|uniref:NADH-quinone oxidoreductase subunit NuoN n=1 Tax=Microbaculum sp. FT89 TaxID=3447298 RepID=UPI003F533663
MTLNLMSIAPEILLVVGAMAALMFGAFRQDSASVSITAGLSMALVIAAGVLVWLVPADPEPIFGGSFQLDPFAKFMKTLIAIGSAVAILLSVDYMRFGRLTRFEYPVLIVLATAGMFVMVSATDLISLYMGLELQSLAAYVLAAIQRDSVRSTEAGMKYFVLGALASGMLLYGASLIYGFCGTVTYEGIADAVAAGGSSIGVVIGLVFLLSGLAFKISAVPFHMWTPDVYEGSPTPVTAFFASAPKIAAIGMLIRVVVEAFPTVTTDWQQIIVFISIASMALGAFAAIGQRNIKRLMAYSSIANMGYALVGLAAGSEAGVQGVIVYMTIYLAMTLGTFAFILAMRRGDTTVETIDDLAGLSRTNGTAAFFLAVLFFSLAGIPPLAGFFAKFYVFLAAIEAELYALAVIGVLTSVVGAFYYLRIVKIMYFDEPVAPFEHMGGELKAVLGVSGVVVLLYFVYPAPLVEAAGAAAKSLF